MKRPPRTEYVAGRFLRPAEGPRFRDLDPMCSGLPAWRSNGGRARLHPDRALPFTLEIALPPDLGVPVRLHLFGVFASHVDPHSEGPGTPGATLATLRQGQIVDRHTLLEGAHYRDAGSGPVHLKPGDGTELRTIGRLEIDGSEVAVDHLLVDLSSEPIDAVRFQDLGTPASFSIFDAFVEVRAAPACPFHPAAGGVALSDIAGIVRMKDRARMQRAIGQLERSVRTADDLDEARGEALTLLAMVTAATLEMGGGRAMHRVQLEAARALEQALDGAEIAAYVRDKVEELMRDPSDADAAGQAIVARAIEIVERSFALKLTDTEVAKQLGLSNSHFRFLFRQTTGVPFHKYVVGFRLEAARRMLAENPELPVSVVARSVGFQGLAHFSRAFSSRFSVNPSSFRRSDGVESDQS